jgi:hypothetical protein
MDTNLLIWLGSQLTLVAAVYGGIRADIRGMHLRLNEIHDSANHAHERIDRILHKSKI